MARNRICLQPNYIQTKEILLFRTEKESRNRFCLQINSIQLKEILVHLKIKEYGFISVYKNKTCYKKSLRFVFIQKDALPFLSCSNTPFLMENQPRKRDRNLVLRGLTGLCVKEGKRLRKRRERRAGNRLIRRSAIRLLQGRCDVTNHDG